LIIISPKHTSKLAALKEISTYYGIDKEDIFYFGDGVNDVASLS
jgi:hydroxymethylpyrimidine pyrophosphatase-like HAD family hydrolase